jgi:hypothetical protein
MNSVKRLKVGPLLASLVATSPTGGVGLEDLGEVKKLPDGATRTERDNYARDSLMILRKGNGARSRRISNF